MAEWTDRQIDGYVEKWGEDPTNRWLVEAAGLDGGEAVLDIGCGSGSALRHAAAQGHSGRLVGVDPYRRMIAHAERLRGTAAIEFLAAPAEALPFAAETFDVVLAINSVHHWSDVEVGLDEVGRVLRPGGRFVYGGEVFGPAMIPGGQDQSPALARRGFTTEKPQSLADGAAIVFRAGKRADV